MFYTVVKRIFKLTFRTVVLLRSEFTPTKDCQSETSVYTFLSLRCKTYLFVKPFLQKHRGSIPFMTLFNDFTRIEGWLSQQKRKSSFKSRQILAQNLKRKSKPLCIPLYQIIKTLSYLKRFDKEIWNFFFCTKCVEFEKLCVILSNVLIFQLPATTDIQYSFKK